MTTLVRSLAVAVGVSLASAQAANASGFSWNGTTICGGNSFATCAAVSVSTTYNAATGRTTVTMVVKNLSGTQHTFGGTVFTQIGVWNLPAGSPGHGHNPPTPGAAYVNGSLGVTDQHGNNVSSNWQLGSNGLSGAGIQGGVFGADPVHGINGGIASGDTFTFTFQLTGLPGSFNLGTAGFAIHGQGGPQGCSTKLVIQGDGSANAGPYDAACTTITTPEPVTMTLLATGLAGLGGAGYFRRRKKTLA